MSVNKIVNGDGLIALSCKSFADMASNVTCTPGNKDWLLETGAFHITPLRQSNNCFHAIKFLK